MPASGAGFGVDLYHLDRVAKHDLPTVVDVYDEAIGKCRSAGNAVHGVPTVPAEFNGANGPALRAHGELHGAIAEVLNSTKTSLEETAEALSKAVTLYAESDQAAANRLHEMFENRGEHNPGPEWEPTL